MPGLVRAEGCVCIGGAGSSGPTIQLSGSTIAQDASIGTAIGTLSVVGGTGSYTFTETLDPDNDFDIRIDGVTLENSATFGATGTHLWTVHADNGGGSIIDKTFTITVTAPSGGAPPARETVFHEAGQF